MSESVVMARVGNLKKSLFNTLLGSRTRIKSEVHQSKMTKRVFAGLLDVLNLNTINRNPYITTEMKEIINKLYADGLLSVSDKRAIVALCKSIHEECLWYAFFSWMLANGLKSCGPSDTPFIDHIFSGAATVLDNWVTHPDVCHQAFINACYKFEVADRLAPKPLYSGLLTHITNQIMALFSDTFQKNQYSGINTRDFITNNIYNNSVTGIADADGDSDTEDEDDSESCNDDDSVWSSSNGSLKVTSMNQYCDINEASGENTILYPIEPRESYEEDVDYVKSDTFEEHNNDDRSSVCSIQIDELFSDLKNIEDPPSINTQVDVILPENKKKLSLTNELILEPSKLCDEAVEEPNRSDTLGSLFDESDQSTRETEIDNNAISGDVAKTEEGDGCDLNVLFTLIGGTKNKDASDIDVIYKTRPDSVATILDARALRSERV